MSDYSPWIPVIGTLGGALVAGASAFGINWINKRSDERKHLNSLMLNAALENWKQACNLAIAQKKAASIAPLDMYIIHMLKLTDVLLNKDLNKSNLSSSLKEIHENRVSAPLNELDHKIKGEHQTSFSKEALPNLLLLVVFEHLT